MAPADKIQDIFLKLERIEFQIGRLISDAESEKEFRKERNKEIERRLVALETWQAKWAGALILLSILATLFSIIAFFKK